MAAEIRDHAGAAEPKRTAWRPYASTIGLLVLVAVLFYNIVRQG